MCWTQSIYSYIGEFAVSALEAASIRAFGTSSLSLDKRLASLAVEVTLSSFELAFDERDHQLTGFFFLPMVSSFLPKNLRHDALFFFGGPLLSRDSSAWIMLLVAFSQCSCASESLESELHPRSTLCIICFSRFSFCCHFSVSSLFSFLDDCTKNARSSISR